MSRYVRYVKDERGVVTLTLNRPEKHNALNAELIAELNTLLISLSTDDHCQLIVITGEGRSFSSGADLAWMQTAISFSEEENRQDAQKLADLMATLYNIKTPTLAYVNGSAFGGGVGLLACCDIVIANDEARFSFSEVKLGLIPAVISPYIIAAIGGRQTRRLFMTGERFTALQAQCYGLVHEVAEPTVVAARVDSYIDLLLSGGPEALIACKKLCHQLAPLPASVDLAGLIARVRTSDEGQAGLKAFLNKTPPPWAL